MKHRLFAAIPPLLLAALLAGCAGLSAGAVAARVQRAVSEFGSGPATDDMALLVLRAL